jgi:hypothetical protein
VVIGRRKVANSEARLFLMQAKGLGVEKGADYQEGRRHKYTDTNISRTFQCKRFLVTLSLK